jgi:ribosome-associated protein
MARTTRKPGKGAGRKASRATRRGGAGAATRAGGASQRRKAPGGAARKAARPGREPARKGRAAAAVPSPRPELDEARERALASVEAGRDKKAEDALVLDVRGLSGVADYFVLMSADSERQAGAIADAVDERLEALGAVALGVEGRSGGGWVLLDFGDVVVHVMDPETRRFYDLEGLWADAPRVKV